MDLQQDAAVGGRERTSSRPILPLGFVAGSAYFLILLFIWGPFATSSGMGWETYYTIVSETATSWRNFLYTPDPLRVYAAFFYELAYRFGDLVGIRGSFVAYQIVYAVLWWARSFLGFVLIRKLAPNSAILPFSIGALMMLHGPDLLIGWLGQMHQLGYLLWLLIALLLLTIAMESRAMKAAPCILVALLFEYLCLWTYEGPLFIILAAPVAIVFVLKRKLDRIALTIGGLWYVPALIYLWLTYVSYRRHGGNAYQMSLLRKSFSPGDILSDWFFNLRYSVVPWEWRKIPGNLTPAEMSALAAGVAIVVLAAAFFVWQHHEGQQEKLRDWRVWRLLVAGLVLLALSFPAQLLLASNRDPRRTQLLSAIAASIVQGSAICLIAGLIRSRVWRAMAALSLIMPVIWLGACRILERQAQQRAEWNVSLTAMRSLLQAVPRIKPSTVVVMTNVPRSPDPFSAFDFWFNNALRLAYPRTEVAGIYYYEGDLPEPTNNLRLADNHWEFTGESVAPLITRAEIGQTLVLKFQRFGPPEVLKEIPPFVCLRGCNPQGYHPTTRIMPGPPAPEPLRRYGPI